LQHDCDSCFQARDHHFAAGDSADIGAGFRRKSHDVDGVAEWRGFLQPAEAMPVRDIPLETLQQWIAEDERDDEGFWEKAGKA